MTLSPLDDYPVHQIPEVMRHVGTSDRNFYDRYYFNAFPLTADAMLIVGLGQYPNLGVTDAFALWRRGSLHRVVRASRELGVDRMNTQVGPFGVEVLEGLKRLRVVLGPNDLGLSFDLTWEGSIPPQVEPQHFIRSQERVVFDSKRMAQTGRWAGSITVDGDRLEVTPDQWWGIRDRSWGIRPVGESEPPGIQSRNAGTFYWLYAPVQFEDHAILCIVQEDAAGRRLLEEAVRVWPDGTSEYLGRPSYSPEYADGDPATREVVSARIGFAPPGGEPFDMHARLLLPVHLMVGTGYGLEPDWKHGKYQGPDLVVQGVSYDLSQPQDAARMWGMVDAVGRFDYDGHTGYGLYEYWALGDHPSFRGSRHPGTMPTVYEAAGGADGILRLARAWHDRVMADEEVSHAFSHGYHPEHSERLAAYWAEALGGPSAYTGVYGDETSVVRIHSGNGPHEEMDRRAIACFDQALADAGLAGDDRLRQVLHDYFAWATTTTMARYHWSADDVPNGLRIPHWSWDGLVGETDHGDLRTAGPGTRVE